MRMRRKKNLDSRMEICAERVTNILVKDRRFEGAYHTPYGDLELALFATQVNVQAGPESGSVHLEYQLDMQGSYAAVQVIDVTYTTEGAC